MPVDHSQIVPGQRISSNRYALDAEAVSRYAEAVGIAPAALAWVVGRGWVPPMAVAALSLRGVVNDLAIPGGTLHVGQELEFKGAVRTGDTLDCRATLVQNSVRGDWRFMVVQLEVDDSKGRRVMDGKSTIMLPVKVESPQG